MMTGSLVFLKSLPEEVHDDQLSGAPEEPLPVEVHDDQISNVPEEPP